MSTANISTKTEKSTNVRPSHSAPAWMRTALGAAGHFAPEATSAVAAQLFRRTRRSAPRRGERTVLEHAGASQIAGMRLWAWGQGPTVLLVHGWNGRATQLGEFVEPLRARGHRVVAFDARGHGDSDGATSSLPELAGDIRQVVDELGGVHAVIAHSLGGAATTYALAYGLRANRAVYISPPADPREFLKVFGDALGIDRDVQLRVQRRVERRLGVPMEEMVAYSHARNMQTPLLVIHDRDDKEVPVAVAQELARTWPGAELLISEGLGHHRILRDETVIDAAVRFIADSRAKRAA